MISTYNENIQLVFVDEAGGTEFSSAKSDCLDYYVIVGIYFTEISFPRYSEAAEAIVRKHAGNGELKSSKIGTNISRRERVLQDIAKIGFPIYCLVVNKSRIWSDSGLRWRPSFYKFLHKMFYSRIKGPFVGIRVKADDYGHSEFMESFKNYIGEFSNIFDDFQFASSKANPLLQIADVIGGTVRRIYMQQDSPNLLKIIGYPSLPIEEWPPKDSWIDSTPEVSNEFDLTITRISLNAARQYVEKKHLEGEQEMDKLRVLAIRYLLQRFEQNPEEYVRRNEISQHLLEATGIDIKPQEISNKVLADARDSDVILASTNEGIKIPFCAGDLTAWMERTESQTESQVAPYLKRVQAARKLILIASHNRHDIANPEIFPELSKYLEASQDK